MHYTLTHTCTWEERRERSEDESVLYMRTSASATLDGELSDCTECCVLSTSVPFIVLYFTVCCVTSCGWPLDSKWPLVLCSGCPIFSVGYISFVLCWCNYQIAQWDSQVWSGECVEEG